MLKSAPVHFKCPNCDAQTPVAWIPGLCGPRVRVLMIVSPQEEMARANPIVSRAVFDCIEGAKEWYSIKGGHFGLLYYPSESLLGSLRRADILSPTLDDALNCPKVSHLRRFGDVLSKSA